MNEYSILRWIVGGSLAVVVLAFVAFMFLFWIDLTADSFELNKADWSCTRSEVRTTYRTVVMGSSSMVVPASYSVCVEYRRNAP